MKYTGYAVTYAPENKVNKHNYFLNGIINDVSEQNSCTDIGMNYGRRSLFALFDGSYSESHGEDASWICADMLQDYIDHNFDDLWEEYFQTLNEAIKGRAFEENGQKVGAALGVVYGDGNLLKAYNIGGVEVYCCHNRNKEITQLSGDIPDSVEIEDVEEDEYGVGHIALKTIKTAPYVGYMSENYAAVPHISDAVRVSDGDLILIATKSLFDTVDKKKILGILKKSKTEASEKVKMIVDLAVEKNPEGNYSAQIIYASDGKKILGIKTKAIAWCLAALLTLGALILPFAVLGNSNGNLMKELKRLMTLFTYRDVINDVEVDPWVPLGRQEDEDENEENEDSEIPEEPQEEQADSNKGGTLSPSYKEEQTKQQKGYVSGVDNVNKDNAAQDNVPEENEDKDKAVNDDTAAVNDETPDAADSQEIFEESSREDESIPETEASVPLDENEAEETPSEDNQNQE